MLRERVERWHQRVALFSSFALYHLMFAAVVVEPGVRAGAAVKLAGEREEWFKGRAGPEPFQHGLARYMVVGADRIDGQHGRARVQLGSSLEELVQALGACPRSQPKLVRKARFLEGTGEVLRQRTGDQAPEDVANDECPHAAIGLAQRNHAPEPQSLEDLLWHVCVGQALGSSVEECAVRRVI